MREYEKEFSEYKEALSIERFQSTLLFGELTVYMAASGSLLKYVISSPTPPGLYRVVLAIAGMILSLSFLLISKRAGDFLHSARNRAKSIEKNIRFSICSDLPERKCYTAINAIYAIYIIGLLIWLFVLLEGRFSFPSHEHWILKLSVSCSYILIILGSVGMILFATKFPFSANIKDLKHVTGKVLQLNGYQVWMFSWGFIIIGTAIQLIAFWAN